MLDRVPATVLDAVRSLGRRAGAVLTAGRWTARAATAPELLRIRADHVELADGRVACTLAVRGYPREVGPGWLRPLLELDGESRVSQHVEPVDSAQALRELDQDLRSAAASQLLAGARGAPVDAMDRAAAEDAQQLRAALARGQVRLFRLHLLITIFAADPAELARRREALLQHLDGRMLVARRCLLEQEAGFAATMPLGSCALPCPRNLDSDALAASLPFGAGEFQQRSGELWGLDIRRGTPVSVDRFALPNANAIVVAGSGSGKSYWMKHLLTLNLLAGRRAAVLDPQGEYGAWAQAVGAGAIRLGAAGQPGINPLAPPRRGGMVPEAWPAARAQRTAALLELLAGAAVDPALVFAALAEASRRASGAPTLSVLAGVLVQGGPPSEPLGRRLQVALDGGLRAFAGEGSAAAAGAAVVFDLREVVGQAPGVAAAAYLLLTHHVIDHLVAPDLPPLTLAVDEAHHLLAQAVGARFLEVLFRSGRKRGVAVCLATQSAGDLLGAGAEPGAAGAARAALANAATVFLMRQQNAREVGWLTDLYRLGPAEAEWLLTCGRGEGLLIAGASRAQVRIEAPEALRAAFSTGPEPQARPP